MNDLESLKTIDRKIAVGNRRVVITFDEKDVPMIYSGILPGDYLCCSPKKGWYCSASVDNPAYVAGIFIDEEGNYLSVAALDDAPCRRKDINLYNMPSFRELKKIENIREVLNNSLTAVGFEKLPQDLSAAFWSCDDRFFNRVKRPLLIQNYKKVSKKHQIKITPFISVKGRVLRTFVEDGEEIDLRKKYKLLLVDTEEKNSSSQFFWVLYELAQNVFYVFNQKLKLSNPIQEDAYQKLLKMPEVRKRLYFPKDGMNNWMFVYEDGTVSGQVKQKKMLGIPFTFRDGARAIVHPYTFRCFDFSEFRKFCSNLGSLEGKKWSLPKREHLVELVHCSAFNQMQNKTRLNQMRNEDNVYEKWNGEWAFKYNPLKGNIVDTWMVPVVRPTCMNVASAYENPLLSTHVMTTLNDGIRVLFVMYC